MKKTYDPDVVAGLCAAAGYKNFAVSFPVPSMIQGHCTDRYFLYSNNPEKLRSRPMVWLELDGSSGAVLSMNHCFVADFVNGEVYPFDKLIDYTVPDNTSVSAQMARIRKLHELYRDVKATAFQEKLTEEEKAVVKQYVRLLEETAPVALMPFYRELGNTFFAWIEEIH